MIPDEKLTLRAGAIKAHPDPGLGRCRDDLMRHAEAPASRATRPGQTHARAEGLGDRGTPQLQGEGNWSGQWYGIRRFFQYLESKAYKMHIRVLLSKVPQLHHLPGVRRRG